MPEKKRNKFIDLLQYLALRSSGMIVQMFSIDAALFLGRVVGDLVYWSYHKHRARALDNLRLAYVSTVSEQWIRQTARASFRHLGMLAMEVLYAPRLLKLDTAFHYITMKNMGAGMRVVAADGPAILLSGHYGNWELLSFVMAAMGLTSYTVARHLPNPYIHRYVFGVRERTGQRFLTKRGATATVTEVLADNQIVCFLADQDAGSRGEFVKFFGQDASTFRSIALLARMYEAPIVIAAATRIGQRFRYEFLVEEVIQPEQWQGKDDEVAWITTRYTNAIERIARRCPEQYLWVHRRWKSKPRK